MAGRTAVVWLLWFVQTFAYYGFFSWIPTLLVHRGITVTRSFDFSIAIYLAQVPGYFSAACASEHIDRKRTMALYLSGAAVCALWLSRMTTGPSITVAGAALSFFLNGTYAALYAYTPEVFPTWVRATGMGLASAFGRIGGITAPPVHRVLCGADGIRRGVHGDDAGARDWRLHRAAVRSLDRWTVAGVLVGRGAGWLSLSIVRHTTGPEEPS